jgi:hypothetical protein
LRGRRLCGGNLSSRLSWRFCVPYRIDTDAGDVVAGYAKASIRCQDAAQIDGVTLRGITGAASRFRLVRCGGVRSAWFVDNLRAEPVNGQDLFEVQDNGLLVIGNIELAAGGWGYGVWAPNRGRVMLQRGVNSGSSITFTGGPWWLLLSAYTQSQIKVWEHCYIEWLSDVDMGVFAECYDDSSVNVLRQDMFSTHGHIVTGNRLQMDGGAININLNSGGPVSISAIPGDLGPLLNGGNCLYNDTHIVSGDNTNTPHEKTANYTLLHADGDQETRINSATGKTVTLPKNFPAGWGCWVTQEGAGQLTFAPESGATMQGKGRCYKVERPVRSCLVLRA